MLWIHVASDAVIALAYYSIPVSLAIRSTDYEGVCVSPVYYFGESTPVPLGRMYTKGIHFHTGRCHARHEIPAVAAAIAAGRLHGDVIANRPPSSVVGERDHRVRPDVQPEHRRLPPVAMPMGHPPIGKDVELPHHARCHHPEFG